MKNSLLLSLAPLALAAASASAQGVEPGTITTATDPAAAEVVGHSPYVEGQLLVRFAVPTPMEAAIEALAGERYFVDRPLIRAMDLYLVRILDGTPVRDAIEELRANGRVRYASPDHLVSPRNVPNDPSFSQQWNMNNTGQTGGTPDADIDAVEAWDIGTGTGAFVVAIVDGGMQINHPDLTANIWANAIEVGGSPGVDDDGNGYIDDKNGWDAYSNDGTIPIDDHGTHVAGIAGARGNNGAGVAGVNWDVDLMAVAGASGVTSTVMLAYGYADDLKVQWLTSGGTEGANVVSTNSSFGVDYANCAAPPYTQWNDAYDTMGSHGILSAAATMNIDANVDVTGDVPTGCSSDYLVTVTNTDHNDQKGYAGYGATTIDLGAPGTSIRSTVSGSGYASYTGTSMASPHVAGTVAFLHSVASASFGALRAADPAGAALELKSVLLATVDVIASLNGKTVSDGRLNLNNAAIAMRDWGGTVDPRADFAGSPTAGDEDLLVAFTDLSTGTGLYSWSWTFGDGGTSAAQNPSYTYVDPGTYTVSLTVTGTNGSDTKTRNGYIVVNNVAEAAATPYNGSGINPNVLTSVSLPILGTSWLADIDGGSVGASGLTFLVGYSAPTSGLIFGPGELLIDVSTPWQFTSISGGGSGISHHSVPIPSDPVFAGVHTYAQGFLNNVGGAGKLTNAYDLELGY
ncbi:MAG: S8 family serine peptidase [Planctomycetota bacterium]